MPRAPQDCKPPSTRHWPNYWPRSNGENFTQGSPERGPARYTGQNESRASYPPSSKRQHIRQQGAMKNRRRWILLMMVGAGLAVLLWYALFLRPGITQANYQRIREEMTLQEVENLLGGPPGNYSRIPDKEAGLWTIDPNRPDLDRQFFIGRQVWIGNELAVAVWFDDQERVVRKESYETLDRSLLQRLHDFLGW